MRSNLDKPIDAVFLLHILKEAAPIYGRTKVQKATFLVEYDLKEKGLRGGPHFSFIRYLKGPFSRQVWDTYDELAEKGFVRKSDFELTERGKFLLELAIPELREKNPEVFRAINARLEWCKRKHGPSLIDYVYRIETEPDGAPGTRMKIGDMAFGLPILDPQPGGLEVSEETAQLIHEELELTQEELADAQRRLPELEQRAVRNLTEALNVDQPS